VYPLKIEAAIKQIEPLYFDLVCEIYQNIQDNKPILGSEQDHSNATYSLWLDQEDYFIDWQWSAEKIKRFVDAVGFPYDGAKARLNEKVIKLEVVQVVDDVYVEHRERHIGKVIFIDTAPIVVCTSGLLKLLTITDVSGQPLNINFRSRFK
jgi:methionyl-tRNA formyltransferase